jgi:hypothetical protein
MTGRRQLEAERREQRSRFVEFEQRVDDEVIEVVHGHRHAFGGGGML